MEDETVQAYCMRTAGLARSIWKKDEVPLLHEIIEESTRRAMGWPDSKKGEHGANKLGTLACLEKYYVVEKTHTSATYAGGPQQSHDVETQVVLV